MTDSLDPEALEDMMTRYVLGDLGRAEAGEFERLLAGNPELAAEVSSVRKALHLLPYAAAVEPPPHLRFSVLRAARAVTTRGSVRTFSSLPRGMVFGAVAALLAIAIGLDSYRLRRELKLQQDMAMVLQQPNVVLSFSLRGTGTLSRALGGVMLDLDAKRAAVVIRDLPALPANQVYRLWALVGEEKVPCGQFNADARGTVLSQLPIPVDAYTAPISQLIVTLEPSSAIPHPVGPTVMVSS